MTPGFAMPGEIPHNGRMPARRAALAVLVALLATAPAHAQTVASAAQKVWTGAQDVAIYSLGLIGVGYKFGGNTPDTGLDCSGLVRYVFQEVTGVTLPRTAKEMSTLGAKVGMGDLKPGDLVFFNTRRFAFSHVGIYLGDNRFVHAPSRGSEVKVTELSQSYWRKHFNGARRLVGEIPALVPNVIPSALASELAIPSTLLAIDPADVTP